MIEKYAEENNRVFRFVKVKYISPNDIPAILIKNAIEILASLRGRTPY